MALQAHAEPMPKFEKSVFDMKYNEKQQNTQSFQNRFKYFGDASKPEDQSAQKTNDKKRSDSK